jgi:2-polyprenyl-3-methyl-5-hydroxy-6-metoxy-1,4-benzoquinol methylase
MPVNNVYLREDAASSFSRSIRYDEAALSQIADQLEEYWLSRGVQRVNLLDVGIGDGAFTVPILSRLEARGRLDYSLDCFDISPHMLKRLGEHLAQRGVPSGKVSAEQRDAEEGLRGRYLRGHYHVAVITFMLHYVRRWKEILEDVAYCLKDGGLLVQAEIAGDMRCVDGYFDAQADAAFMDFWRRYFALRNRLSEWRPEISVSDLSAVYDYLQKAGGFTACRRETFLWDLTVTWADLCGWIAAGPLSSLGSGLNDPQRRDLSLRMQEWLLEHGFTQSDTMNLRWGFTVTWLKKNRRCVMKS